MYASLLLMLVSLTDDDVSQNESVATFDLDENEAAFSMGICYFERMGGEPTLVVGTAVNATLVPRACKEGWLRVYAMRDNGRVLELMHKVSIPCICILSGDSSS